MRHLLFLSLLLTSVGLSGCQTTSDSSYGSVELPPVPEGSPNASAHKAGQQAMIDNTPALSSDELESVAANCRAEITQLHGIRHQVPRPRLQEYAMTLGIASDACTKLTGLLSQIREATHWKRAYQLNLQHAQSTAEGIATGDVTPPFQGKHSNVIVESEPLTIN